MTVVGLLLAAGAGSRFGGPKALVRVDGVPLVVRGARMLAAAGCGPVLVVAGASAADVAAETTGAGVPGCRVVVADDWAEGIAASLRAGLAAAGGTEARAAVVALADQPLIGPAAVRRLLAARDTHRAGDPRAWVATYAGRPRNPVLLDRRVWADVARAASGDVGARAWLRENRRLVTPVACDGTGDPTDIDTPADLRRLHEHMNAHLHAHSPGTPDVH